MIEAISAGFRYRFGGYIFKRHSFRLEEGRILAILGPNGRGKTTLLKTMIGLLALTEGKIVMDSRYGYVPQQTSVTFPYSVLDMVVMGRGRLIPTFSSPKKHDYHIAERTLDAMGLQGFADRGFLELSGGEKQLVLIARALVSECRVLILDEPASALDFKNQNLILQTLRRISLEQQLTVVFTTHFPQHAVHIADRVLLMQTPEDYLFGSTGEIMTDANLQSLYGMAVRNITFNHQNRELKTIIPVFT